MKGFRKKERLSQSPLPPETHPEEERAEVRLLKQKKKRDDALCFLILGSLCLILSAVFLVLSHRYNFLHVRVFIPGSVEFVVCCLLLAGGVALLSTGATILIKAQKEMKRIRLEGEKR